VLLLFGELSPPSWVREVYCAGFGIGQRFKQADAPEVVHALSGMLYVTPSNWGLLAVPNALVRGVYSAIDEPGVELPSHSEKPGKLDAHISVFRPEDIAAIGGPGKLTERGKHFHYTTGQLKTVQPAGWPQMSKVWMLEVKSPELQTLRQSYGLTPLPHDNDFQFHITVGVRRKGVLGRNEISKSILVDDKPADPLPVPRKFICSVCGHDDCAGCTGTTQRVHVP
jgi:hypothetical protein